MAEFYLTKHESVSKCITETTLMFEVQITRSHYITTIIKIWFGYVWLFHNETSKDLLHAQQHLKTWVLLQKGVALPSENESNKQVRCVVYRWPC